MRLYFYGLCSLVSIFGLHSTSAAFPLPDKPVQILPQHKFTKEHNKPGIPRVNSVKPGRNNQGNRMDLNLEDLVAISTRPRHEKFTKVKERRDVVLKAIRQILEHKNGKTDQNNNKTKQDTLNLYNVDSIAASDLVELALSKIISKRSVSPEKENSRLFLINAASHLAQTPLVRTRSKGLEKVSTEIDEMNKAASNLARTALTKTRSKWPTRPKKVSTMINEMNNAASHLDQIALAKTRSKVPAKPQKVRTRTDKKNNAASKISQLLLAKTRSKGSTRTKKVSTMINKMNNASSQLVQIALAKTRSKGPAKPQKLRPRTDEKYNTASDLTQIVLAKTRSKGSIRPKKVNTRKNEIYSASPLAQMGLAKTRSKGSEKVSTEIDKMNKAASDLARIALTRTGSKWLARPGKVSTRINDMNSAASYLVQIAQAKARSKGSVRPEKINTRIDEIDNAASDLALVKARLKGSARPGNVRVNTRIDEINNAASHLAQRGLAKTILKRCPRHEKGNRRIFETDNVATVTLAETRLKGSATHEKVNRKIEDINKGRDIVLEAVSKLIENEKTRKRFDMVNPPKSKFSKRQQLLWDRLRIKATEELLLHPKTFPRIPTERIFDSLKLDLEMSSPVPTLEPGLFNEFKRRIQKQFYLYEHERGRARDIISTLKPVLYE